jgi:hypothetical protein
VQGLALKPEEERRKKKGKKKLPPEKKKTIIFLRHVLPNNGNNAVGIKKSSWKPEFGCRTVLFVPSKNHGRTHAQPFGHT